MPVYDYICTDCQNSFELVLTLGEHDKSDIRCPKCESKNVEQDAVAFYAVTSKKSRGWKTPSRLIRISARQGVFAATWCCTSLLSGNLLPPRRFSDNVPPHDFR